MMFEAVGGTAGTRNDKRSSYRIPLQDVIEAVTSTHRCYKRSTRETPARTFFSATPAHTSTSMPSAHAAARHAPRTEPYEYTVATNMHTYNIYNIYIQYCIYMLEHTRIQATPCA